MELIEGSSLADLLGQGGGDHLEVDHVVAILSGIASGLAAVHAQGIVHRDLKPANVMIAHVTGRPVVTDFGFAADLESKQSRRLVGTPSFWAPEQARGESPTPASDVYSFGILAYRLLSHREFVLSDVEAIHAVPRKYRSFVARCLEPRPSDRYPDGGQVLLALNRASQRHPWRWVTAASALAVMGLAVAGALGRTSPSTENDQAGQVLVTASKESTTTGLRPSGEADRADREPTAPAIPPASSASATPETTVADATSLRPGHPSVVAASSRRSVSPAKRPPPFVADAGLARPATSVHEADRLYRH